MLSRAWPTRLILGDYEDGENSTFQFCTYIWSLSAYLNSRQRFFYFVAFEKVDIYIIHSLLIWILAGHNLQIIHISAGNVFPNAFYGML